tara:strand:+ start:155 stop:442 length:288 start_codon:yes stop_codon:yes gene_type:complete
MYLTFSINSFLDRCFPLIDLFKSVYILFERDLFVLNNVSFQLGVNINLFLISNDLKNFIKSACFFFDACKSALLALSHNFFLKETISECFVIFVL